MEDKPLPTRQSRILINATMLGNRSGTGRYSRGVLTGLSNLAKTKPEVSQSTVVYLPSGYHFEGLNCDEVAFDEAIIERILWEQTQLSFAKSRYDLLHGLAFSLPYFYRGKGIVTVHDMAYHRFPETIPRKRRIYYKVIFDSSITSADRIIAVSNFTKSEIIHFFPSTEDKIEVIYPGGSLLPKIEKNEEEDVCKICRLEDPFFLTVGTLEPRKNLDFLLSTYRKYLREGGLLDLAIVGKMGWLQSDLLIPYQDLIQSHRVHVLGYLTDRELATIYAAARALIFPSLYEGFGLPLLEAWQQGTPTLVSKGHALSEIGADAALFFDPYDSISLMKRMFLLEDQVDAAIYGLKGMERQKEFSWDKCVSQLWKTYMEVLGK